MLVVLPVVSLLHQILRAVVLIAQVRNLAGALRTHLGVGWDWLISIPAAGDELHQGDPGRVQHGSSDFRRIAYPAGLRIS